MLERVRRALGRSGAASESQGRRSPPRWPELGEVLPPIPPHQLVEQFETELRKVAGIAYRASSVAELQQILQNVLLSCPGGRVVLSRNPLLARLALAEKLQGWGRPVTVWRAEGRADGSELSHFRRQCFSAEVGVSGVDFALAESGSLVLTSVSEGSQLVSVAPPVHIALYRRAQVVESLEEVLRQLPALHDASRALPGRSVVFITGPSRTADIEQISVRGVHGPVQVHAILIEETCFCSSAS